MRFLFLLVSLFLISGCISAPPHQATPLYMSSGTNDSMLWKNYVVGFNERMEKHITQLKAGDITTTDFFGYIQQERRLAEMTECAERIESVARK